jgi:hypothetical protein
MATTLLATVTTTQEIASGEDHQSIFEVIILALREHLWFVARFHFD